MMKVFIFDEKSNITVSTLIKEVSVFDFGTNIRIVSTEDGLFVKGIEKLELVIIDGEPMIKVITSKSK